MDNNDQSFDDFLSNVDPIYREFAMQMHEHLLQNDCKLKMMLAKNGYVVSYQHGKKKHVILNFVFRKSSLFARIYCEMIGRYTEVLAKAPASIVKTIEKAPKCKRFENPPKCNPKCSGYVFAINGKQHQKCRFNCFLLAVEDESIPLIRTLVDNELQCRLPAEG